MMVNYCVPEERRAEMREELKTEFEDTEVQTLGYSMIGNLFGYYTALGLRYVVHIFAG